ncbi:MAG: tetratricopeptide repeat protein [Prevotellaceae bacterium]|nr:tetratricopeptide repeat protein [Prevotellaceae bacterium]
MKRLPFLFITLLLTVAAMAQTDRQHIRQGNKAFRSMKYDQAEVSYRKALAKKPSNSQALYNMGCVLMQKENTPGADSLAVETFKKAAKAEVNKRRKAMSYHNMGVIFQQARDFQQAIEAYKEALRNNPKDNQTRYNLALCQRQLKKNGGGGSSSQQKKDDKKQSEQQKKDQNKQDQNTDKKQEPSKPRPQQGKMSKDNAQQLLNAAIQEEKKTQQRMQKAMRMPQTKSLKKNW